MLPTLERLIFRPNSTATTRVLVLVPTRELGVQVYQVTKQLCQFTDIQIGLAVGGLDVKTQENILRQNPDIVVATPGRLIDHLHSAPTFNLDSIEILILDEADRMLDEYFAEQMKEIIKQCSRTRQTMLFSATMTDEVNDLVAVSLKEPTRIFVDSNKDVAFNLRQEFIRIRSNREADREPVLAALVCRTFRDHCIVFVQTKKQAHRLHIMLGLLGVKVAELHGNLTQPQRLDTLQRFKDEQVDVVVATDVAARGLDIVGVKTVINFVMPATMEHYIHRVGRTARAGRAGVSVSLAGEQERKIVKDVIKSARNPVKSRVIPNDILEKYRKKLGDLEGKIEQILKEEYQERLLSRTENQLNRTEKLIKGDTEQVRPWFQTQKERTAEKTKLSLQTKQSKKHNSKKNNRDISKGPDKKHSKKKESADFKVRAELNKVALVQARLAKRKSKLKKIQSYNDNDRAQIKNKKKRSNFADDLCNTTKSNVKKLKYRAKNKENSKHQTKGKAFGKPQPKKRK